ncbi:ABC transporter substrate-binding protein [Halocatena marina]|uniref:ABC transporter substrate-binding protein n=1 Tax=Halocatena marina TaxID=2934937 RepID=UPI00200FAC1F|nr:PotD/PotF family extracellular solute-binding protein [Halocatena marina]
MGFDTMELSRRNLVKYGLAGGAISLAGCLGGGDGGRNLPAKPVDAGSVPPENLEQNLNVWNWYDGWVNWAVEEFEGQYDTSVTTAAYSNPSKWYTKLEAENDEIDSISATSAWVVRSMDNDFLHALPIDRMDGWSALNELAKSDAEEYYQRNGAVYAIPEAQVAHPLTYSTDYFDDDPGSWDVLWQSDLKGKVSMQDWGEVACRIAALYTGQDPNDPDDFKEIEEALIQQKDLNVTYWKDHSTVQQMFENEQIVATVYTDGRTYNGRFQKGISMDMSNTKEGFMYTYDTFVIPKGAPNPNAAVAWTDMGSKPQNATKKVTTMGYLPPIKNIGDHLDLSNEKIDFLSWPQKMSDSATFIQPLPDDFRKKFDEIWTKVKAA